MDLLRASIIFAGAGLDSSLKQLIRDSTWALTHTDELTGRKLRDFTTRFLADGEHGVSPKRLAEILRAGGSVLPREKIVERYVFQRHDCVDNRSTNRCPVDD